MIEIDYISRVFRGKYCEITICCSKVYFTRMTEHEIFRQIIIIYSARDTLSVPDERAILFCAYFI